MVLLTVRFDPPLFESALAAAPETTLEFEDCSSYSERSVRILVRARDGDLDEFERALDEDGTVGDVRRLSAVGCARVYRVLVGRDRTEARIYEALVRLDGYVVEGVGDADGWQFRLAFPDRSAVAEFSDWCASTGVKPMIRSVRPDEDADGAGAYGLTQVQGDTLRGALADGYFEVPRRTTLGDLADRFDVSDQAVSERLRRGTSRLVTRTLGDAGS
jgi:hypothetical protein